MIKELIEQMKLEWNEAKYNPNQEDPFFKIKCEFSESKALKLPSIDISVPEELLQFWSISDSAKLFFDVDFGQWGLEILSPERSIQKTEEERLERGQDFDEYDLLIGQFLGDSELLLICCDKSSSLYGSLKIVMPIDPRRDWPTVAKNFADFLLSYSSSYGDKFWE